MILILVIVLIILLLGGLPAWHYHPYGYTPSGIIAVILVLLVLWVLLGRP